MQIYQLPDESASKLLLFIGCFRRIKLCQKACRAVLRFCLRCGKMKVEEKEGKIRAERRREKVAGRKWCGREKGMAKDTYSWGCSRQMQKRLLQHSTGAAVSGSFLFFYHARLVVRRKHGSSSEKGRLFLGEGKALRKKGNRPPFPRNASSVGGRFQLTSFPPPVCGEVPFWPA